MSARGLWSNDRSAVGPVLVLLGPALGWAGGGQGGVKGHDGAYGGHRPDSVLVKTV